jgi:hypothetical protein
MAISDPLNAFIVKLGETQTSGGNRTEDIVSQQLALLG